MHRQKSKTKKIYTACTLFLILLVFLAAAALWWSLKADQTTKNPDTSSQPYTSNSDSGVNLEPATEEEKKEADQHKDEPPKEDENTADNKKSVEPVITFLGQRNNAIEVRSYVSEVYEDTGTCTASFTMGSQKIERSVEGIMDATYTRCARIVVPVEEFDKGTWSVTVRYSSPKAEGISPAREIVIK